MDRYKKIDKRNARKRWNNGESILLVPCKHNPNSNLYFVFGSLVNKSDADCDTFDSVVNQFEYYNCQYGELGRYAAYYIKED